MIKRVRIKGYKSLRDFSFEPSDLTVVFGPNAAGKSNFLDALQLFSRMSTSKTIKDAFNPPYRGKPLESFTYPENGITGLLDKDNVSFSMIVDIELSDSIVNSVNRQILEMRKGIEGTENPGRKTDFITERNLRYELEIELIPKGGFLRVSNERLCSLKKDWTEKKSRPAFLEKKEGHLSLRMEGQAHPSFYDIGLDHTILSLPLYPPHYPHVTAAKQEMEGWQFFYFEPRVNMRAPNATREVNHIGMMGEDLAAYLNTIKGTERFQAIQRSLRVIIPAIESIDTEIDRKSGEVELVVYENGLPISARLVSEGTLRILGLLSIGGGDNPSVICFEEPENGIHPRRIALIAEYLKNAVEAGSQIIVTTHSAVLPDLIRNESLFVCRKEKGNTVFTPFNESGLFRDNAIERGLEDDETLPSDMILRGDFDA